MATDVRGRVAQLIDHAIEEEAEAEQREADGAGRQRAPAVTGDRSRAQAKARRARRRGATRRTQWAWAVGWGLGGRRAHPPAWPPAAQSVTAVPPGTKSAAACAAAEASTQHGSLSLGAHAATRSVEHSWFRRGLGL